MGNDKYQELILLSTEELITRANIVRRDNIGNVLEMCSVINAKSGSCSEDCKFCAQSAHHCVNIQEYSLKSEEDIISASQKAVENGAGRFGIVTSGNKLTKNEINSIASAIKQILEEVDIEMCASLGALDTEAFTVLKDAGLTRYHHNIETSERFYPEIVSTHDFSERINTIRNAKEAGMEVCSGGIFGMGETWQDRLDMAVILKELEVDSVPINFLVPIDGTPFAGAETISPIDAVRSIAIFRIILEHVAIKVAAGRESVLKDFQGMMFNAGANGMMIGGYLTVTGRPPEEDRILISEIKKLWNNE